VRKGPICEKTSGVRSTCGNLGGRGGEGDHKKGTMLAGVQKYDASGRTEEQKQEITERTFNAVSSAIFERRTFQRNAGRFESDMVRNVKASFRKRQLHPLIT
jgi:hypothetical protein